jgi:hypothetical protein
MAAIAKVADRAAPAIIIVFLRVMIVLSNAAVDWSALATAIPPQFPLYRAILA